MPFQYQYEEETESMGVLLETQFEIINVVEK